jgi:hypothetical protein
MKILAAAWCAALFVSLVLPAVAQSASEPPLLGQPNPPFSRGPFETPSPESIAKETAAEEPSVTNVAKGLYSKLLGGSLNGYRFTSELQSAWTPSIEATAAADLVPKGTPSWSFIGNGLTGAGTVSVYRLQYANAGPVYMSVGVTDDGVVYALRLADSARAAAPPPAQ